MKKQHLVYLFCLFFFACAIVKPPQGGPKDTTAPSVLQQTPSSGALNFQSLQIIYIFDEFIELNNFNQEVTVSPFLDPKEIETLIKGKKLILTLPPTLIPNTTYTFKFGNAIRDITERNAIENLSLTFSTGPTIDSLYVKGQILNQQTFPANQDILIGLYDPDDSISPVSHTPIHFIKTKTDTFTIPSLPSNNYQVFAFNDINSNYLYDSLTERIAFSNTDIITNENPFLSLNFFKEDFRKFTFSRPIYKDNIVSITFSKGLKSIVSDQPYLYTPNNKTIKFYSLNSEGNLSFLTEDSTGHILDTNLVLSPSPSKFIDSVFTLSQSRDYIETKNHPGITLLAPHLISKVILDSIVIIYNRDTIPPTDARIKLTINPNSDTIRLEPKNLQDTVSMVIPAKSITSLSNHYNKRFLANYTPSNTRLYGSMSGKITTTEKNYILYLYTNNNQLISTLYNPKIFNFPNLVPNTYKILVLIDTNNNKTYDTGNLKQKQQAETLYIYEKPLVIKPNWDIGNVNISF